MERTRLAARNRRSDENDIMRELAQQLPIERHIIESLDKASVIRLIITYLKLQQRSIDIKGK